MRLFSSLNDEAKNVLSIINVLPENCYSFSILRGSIFYDNDNNVFLKYWIKCLVFLFQDWKSWKKFLQGMQSLCPSFTFKKRLLQSWTKHYDLPHELPNNLRLENPWNAWIWWWVPSGPSKNQVLTFFDKKSHKKSCKTFHWKSYFA